MRRCSAAFRMTGATGSARELTAAHPPKSARALAHYKTQARLGGLFRFDEQFHDVQHVRKARAPAFGLQAVTL